MNKLPMLLPLIGVLVAFNADAEVPGRLLSDIKSDVKADLQAYTPVSARLLGDLASPAEGSRTITLTPDTTYVNVTHGEVVDFKSNGQEFAIRFDGADDVSSFNLQRLAAAGALDHPVTADIAPNGNEFD
ncbi:MAG TPA: CzcE family metal-binding protein [Burkholderiaceae bacterium]|nr:CzcE family metal-binding protein [Burkholderiaceae bacterium]